VNADPKLDPLVFRKRSISLQHSPLHRNRTRDRLDDARELDQDAIAGRLDDAALVLGDLRVDQFAAQSLEPCKGTGLILSYQPAVAATSAARIAASLRSTRSPDIPVLPGVEA
jgi:hypothetical protein